MGIGAGTDLYDVVEDTAVGVFETFDNPKGTVESLYHSVTNPVETYKYIEKSIVDPYERDMINGDAESRSHWATYTLGTIATAVVGTKGAGALTKTGVATTKTAVQKSVTIVPNMLNTMQSSRLAQILPYGPRTQVAMPGGEFFSVVNGPVLRDQLISMAKPIEKMRVANAFVNNKSKLYRGDSLPDSPTRPNGIGKPHISSSGDLIPASKFSYSLLDRKESTFKNMF